MSRATIARTTLMLAALAFAASPAACGTDAQQLRQSQAVPTASPTGAQTVEQAIARRLDGLYTASIGAPALREATPGLHLPAGTWALRIDVGARTLQLIPPEGGDITLRLVRVVGSQLRLAPDTACESHAGRTAGGRLAWLRTNTLLRLRAVRVPCSSDATVLTSTPWRAAWPATALTANAQPIDAS